METINLNIEKALGKGAKEQLLSAAPKAEDAIKTLHKGNGKGNDFLGWIDLPVAYDKEEFARIKKAAEKIKISTLQNRRKKRNEKKTKH